MNAEEMGEAVSAAGWAELTATVRAVLELHKPVAGECQACVDPADSHWNAIWPCETYRVVADTLGVDR